MATGTQQPHFIPKFYIAGFTKAGQVDGDLHVFDQERVQRWQSTPEKSARWRDFYRVETGADPDAVEKALAQLETDWSRVIRQISERRALPADADFTILLTFVAVMAVRVPRFRTVVGQANEKILKTVLWYLVHDDQSWEYFKQANSDAGHEIDDSRRDDIRAFVDADDYAIDMERTWHIKIMLDLAERLVPLLGHRRWQLWTAKEDAPDLICSDSPVSLSYLKPSPYPPGFGTANTVLSMTLTRRIALVSMLDVDLGPLVMNDEDVASMNSATAMYGNQLFSSESNFIWKMKNGALGGVEDLEYALQPRQNH